MKLITCRNMLANCHPSCRGTSCHYDTKTWNVFVERDGRDVYLGTVVETTEMNARCAALSKFGTEEEDSADPKCIGPYDTFHVSRA